MLVTIMTLKISHALKWLCGTPCEKAPQRCFLMNGGVMAVAMLVSWSCKVFSLEQEIRAATYVLEYWLSGQFESL